MRVEAVVSGVGSRHPTHEAATAARFSWSLCTCVQLGYEPQYHPHAELDCRAICNSPRCSRLHGSTLKKQMRAPTCLVLCLAAGRSDCTRRATHQQGSECDKDTAALPPYLPTSDEATPAARSVLSGGTTTSSSTRHAGVEEKKERTVSSADDLPCSVLTEFLLSYCADSSLKSSPPTSAACKQTVKDTRLTGGKRAHRGVENSVETPAEPS